MAPSPHIFAAEPHFPYQGDFLAYLRDNLFLYGGRGFFAVIGLLVFLLWILPPHRRAILRGPMLFLALYPLLCAVRLLFPWGTPLRPLFGYLALFFFLSSLGKTLFLTVEVVILERIGRPMPKIALDVVQIVILMAVFIVVLHEAGIEGSTLLTGSAVLGAGLSLALRDTIGNLVAGLIFQMQRPFQVGDWIQFDDKPHHVGKVTEINWRETKVITLDEAEVILPNGTLAIAYIRNFTQPEQWSRRSLYVMAPYDVPPNRVQEIILDAIAGSFGILRQPPPSVVTYSFTERGIEYWVRFFTTEFGRRDKVDGEARDRIWYALARNGIEIPVATHAVRMTPLPPPEPEPLELRQVERERLLKQIDVFSVLPEDCLKRIAARAREILYGQGEVVIRQGDAGHSMYLIEEGQVVVSAAMNGQPTVEINRLGAAEFFGEMSLLTGAVRSATVATASQCRLLEVDKAAVKSEMECHPELAERFGKVLAERQRALTKRLTDPDINAPPEPKKDFFQQIREFFSLT